eukprot:175904-Rhodomonas_salina.2
MKAAKQLRCIPVTSTLPCQSLSCVTKTPLCWPTNSSDCTWSLQDVDPRGRSSPPVFKTPSPPRARCFVAIDRLPKVDRALASPRSRVL